MPNSSIKNEKMYEDLRKEGNSKQKAARISNAAAARGKSSVGKKGGKRRHVLLYTKHVSDRRGYLAGPRCEMREHADVDHPERDQRWDHAARAETETERLDRNWCNLLQELRVAQTGVQLLTGFLLTLPFQPRFDRLDDTMRAVYVATVSCSVAATLALVAPRCHAPAAVPAAPAQDFGVGDAPAGLRRAGAARSRARRRDGGRLRCFLRPHGGDARGLRRAGELCDLVDGFAAVHASGRET